METWILEAVKSQILVAEDDAEHLAAQALRREWEKNGWPFASEYQLATFSFPFLDYSTHGVEADASRMAEYVASEPDPGIVSNCTVDVSGISLPETRVVCEGLLSSPLPRPSRQTPTALDRETLLNALAGTFGELRVTDTDSRRRTRRTSPSGGARHPSEGYVVALDVAGLANGIYHCCWRRGKLHRVGGATQVRPDVVRAACPWFYRFGDPAAIVIVTAVFERNMFRYREPRTLRTIFMDAGHLCSTLELLCAAYGLPTLVHHGIDDERVEELLNLEPLTEAAIAAVAIGVQE